MLRRFSQSRLLAGCLVFASAFFLRLLPHILHHSVAHGDEIFQALEQAHRLVFGYGVPTWEFAYGARSWIVALLSAGPMAIAKALHAGPALYVPLIAAVFAAVGATTSLCLFLRARDFYGTAGAAAAAIASTCWVDNLYFGARALSEPLATHLLILAVFLASTTTQKRCHLVLAGFLAGAAFAVRMQIAPAIALLWLWPPVTRRRLVFLTMGAAIALTGDAVLDIVTWGAPFTPLWQNFRFNFLMDGAAHFSTAPWPFYFRFMSYNWGASAAIFASLALLGARRMPILLAMAITIIAAHLLVAHKEYRFIFPAIAMLSILAGLGLVELTRLIAYGLAADRSRPAPAGLSLLMGFVWATMSLLNLTGRVYQQNWDRSSDILAAQLNLSRLPELCGVGFEPRIAWTGGYTYLHRPVPIYALNSPAWKNVDMIPAVNVLVASPASTFSWLPAFHRTQCFGTECIFTRPGGCKPLTLLNPPAGPLTTDVVDFYTNIPGVIPR